MKYVLSYGGGVNSSALYFYIVHMKKLPLDVVLFADTGEEFETTYQSVEKMKEQCIKDRIQFITVKSKFYPLYNYYYEKKRVPLIHLRDCTSKFKIQPIRTYIRKHILNNKFRVKPGETPYITQYLGITWDEAHRVSKSDANYIEYSYPFVDDKIDRKGNSDILNKFEFIASKSGCKGCPFSTNASWNSLSNEEFERWAILEEQNTGYPKIKLTTKKMPLRQIRNKIIKDEVEDLTCKNLHGGCFL